MAKKFSDNAIVTANLAMSIRPTGELVRLDTERVADRIRGREKDRLEAMILNGQDLAEVKAFLPHGEFGAWLDEHFGWSPQHARRLMALGQYAKTNDVIRFDDGVMDGDAALILSAPSCPPKAIEKVGAKVGKNEYVSHKYVRDLVKSLKPKKKESPKTEDAKEEEESPVGSDDYSVIVALLDSASIETNRKVLKYLNGKLKPPAKKKSDPELDPIPENLDAYKFRIAWCLWKQHRKEKKQALKPSTIKLQLKKLGALSVADAVDMIEHSIEQGYTGLFARDDKGKNGKPKRKVIRV